MKRPRKTPRDHFLEPGLGYFLTYSCYRRLPLLRSARTRNWVIDSLRLTRDRFSLQLWAYVVMPEHVHVLFVPTERTESRRVRGALKKYVAGRAREYLESTDNQPWIARLTVTYPSRRVFRFWQQGGGYGWTVFREGPAARVIDYIHQNPVRRGLVREAIDWRWSSAGWWYGAPEFLIEMDAER